MQKKAPNRFVAAFLETFPEKKAISEEGVFVAINTKPSILWLRDSFSLSDSLSSLVASGYIRREKSNKYKLTEKGAKFRTA
jgi:hypothetical protein